MVYDKYMRGYYGNRHQITIDGQTFMVDSNQEEKLIRWVEANGFHDKWIHRDYGVNVGQNNYTPDLELSVLLPDGMTHRALVESKPSLNRFNDYISRRMRGVAKHYYSEVLLLYTHDTDTWYRIDIKTGQLSRFGVPVPGDYPINKLYKPFTKKAPRIRSHTYRQRLALGKMATLAILDMIEGSIQSLFGVKKTKRRRYRKR